MRSVNRPFIFLSSQGARKKPEKFLWLSFMLISGRRHEKSPVPFGTRPYITIQLVMLLSPSILILALNRSDNQ